MPVTLHFGRREWSASWWMAALTLAAVVLFVGLGRWQWHRADYKRALAASFVATTHQIAPLGARAVATLPRYAHIEVAGTYDSAHQFLLDNITHADRAGYDVLTPLILADGRTLMVNRGWIALINRRQLPDVTLAAAGAVSVRGKLDVLPVVAIALGRAPPVASAPWPKVTSFPSMTQLAEALGRPLQARQLLLDADQPHGFVRDWTPNEGFGPTRHIAYAIQWWGFAALALVLFGALNLRKVPS